ncbi:MAG: O-antigen ligase family protein, partial [Ardenticatenaceae bacterium]
PHTPHPTRFWPRDSPDWLMVLFVIWGGVSLLFAQRFGVAAREFRVVVAESVVWFWLVRHSGLAARERRRLVDALLLSATLVAMYGLYQWVWTADIIQAEGVRRIRAVYGSPNNLSLLLERVLPIAGAVALLAPRSGRRFWYGVAIVPLAAALFLTFSRGSWLLGVPAGLLWLAWWGGARARRWVAVIVVVGLLALLPFGATERVRGVLDLESSTSSIRLALWQATGEMLEDYPVLGVGLDNFLYAYDSYRLPEAWREPDLSHPHQIILHFWVALGLPGVALLIGQQVAFWRAWIRVERKVPKQSLARALLVGLGASMGATLAHGMIDNAYFLVDLAFIWMLTMALVGELSEE